MSGTVTRYSMLLFCVWLLAVMLLQFEPLNDVDVYWQVRLGQMMLEQGRLITADPFTFTHAGAAVPTIGWLAQLIFAALYGVGSWRLVQIAHVMLFAGAFWIAGQTAVRWFRNRGQGISVFSVMFALFLGYIAGASNSMVRPQSFGIFCFAALLYLLRTDWRLWVKLIALIPLLLIWQNTHPSVVIGGGAVVALAGAAWLVRMNDKQAPTPWSLTLIVMLVGLAQLATPMGWDIFATSAANVHMARDVLGVSEWMPPWHAEVREAMLGFGLSLAVTVGLLIALRRRVRLADLALFAAMTVLALSAARFAVFWAVAMVPIWARWIEQVKPQAVLGWRGEVPARNLLSALVMGLGLPVAVLLPAVLQGPVADQFALSAGIARLKQVVPAGRIYNFREWGGPLILAGHPDWQLAIDGRLYLYGERDWQAYNDAAAGAVPLDDLVRQYQPDAFFLRPNFHDKLIERLRHAPDWREDYRDANCSIFVR